MVKYQLLSMQSWIYRAILWARLVSHKENLKKYFYKSYYTDINECTTNPSICHSLAVCKNTLGSYICECPNGYTLGYDKFTCVGEYIILILQELNLLFYVA